jgi:FkbH-like protein
VHPKLAQVLAALDERPTVAAYMRAAREARALAEHLRPVRVALLSSYTVDPLVPFLAVEAARAGFDTAVYVGEFNAATQELLDPESGCARHRPDVVFLLQRLADACPALADDFLAADAVEHERETERLLSELVDTLTAFRARSSASVVVANFPLPSHPLLGIYEVMSTHSQTAAIRALNERLVAAARTIPGVHVLDFDRLCAALGYRHWQDDKMWHLGRAPLSATALPALARACASFVGAVAGTPRKCLVLDLDNTLWGGVLGEEGVAGIALGHSYPGSVFRHFQQVVLQLHRRGVILAINSKNNPADVDEVFRTHPDMVLRREHFACARVNWEDKPANMLAIAEELDIGVDSMAFFDDNPAERALMAETLPGVLTLHVPADPLAYASALLDSGAFDKLSFTDEDRRRGEMYQQQRLRRALDRTAHSLDAFYEGLEMVASIRPVDEFAFPRVLDLIGKTNQFNLTTRRYTASELAAMVSDPDHGVFCLRARDRFGDHGIVGVAIVHDRAGVARIDTLLLSCRIIGRTMETALLAHLVDWARARGLEELRGEFIPTAKNAPAADFFPRHGFAPVAVEDGLATWRLRTTDVPFRWPVYIQVGHRTDVLEGAQGD